MSNETNFMPSGSARISLARRLGLPYSDDMQDWEWEVADPARFDDCLRLYEHARLSSDERRSLMEVLVQCADHRHGKPEGDRLWQAIQPWLVRHRGLHGGLIAYWTCQDAEDPDDPEQQFRLSLAMRAVMASNERLDDILRFAHGAWDRGDLATALAQFRLAAPQDDSALICVGYFHDEGIGKPRSKHDAMACYMHASRRGECAATSNIAILHRERGNARRVLRWFAKASAQGDGDAGLNLAKCYAAGTGTPRWRSRAITHARAAARSTCITPAGRDEAKTLLHELTGATRARFDRIRRRR